MVKPACLLVLLLLSSGVAGAAELTASVDRSQLYINEHVLLTLALVDSDTRLRAEGVSPNVDLTLLTGQFELGVPRADFRFNVNRNRGRSSSTITVDLFPRHSGRLTIPSFEVDGLTTEPIELRVLELPDDASEEVFSRSGVADSSLYPRAQTLVYLDLYHRVDVDTARLGGPIETNPRQVELHQLPRGNRVENVDGIDYQVTRTAWAISPLSSEPITIFLPDIWVETEQGRRWRLPLREESIEVLPLPRDVPADALIGRPSLSANELGQATAGQMTPWEVTLRTTTALNTLPMQLPFGERTPEVRIFMDPPERRLEYRPDGGVESVAVYRGSVMPVEPGAFSLPAITLQWFDPGQRRVARLEFPGPVLQVIGPAADEPTATSRGGPPADRDNPGAAPDLRLWQTAAAILLVAWLSTLAAWWRWKRPSAVGKYPAVSGRRSAALPAEAGKARLLAAFGSRTLEQGLRARERRFGIDEELRAVVREVQRSCYHSSSGGAARSDLIRRVDRVIAKIRRERSPRQEAKPDRWSPRAFHPVRGRRPGE